MRDTLLEIEPSDGSWTLAVEVLNAIRYEPAPALIDRPEEEWLVVEPDPVPRVVALVLDAAETDRMSPGDLRQEITRLLVDVAPERERTWTGLFRFSTWLEGRGHGVLARLVRELGRGAGGGREA